MTSSSIFDSMLPTAKYSDTDVIGIVAIVVGVCVAITLFFTFLSKSNKGKYTGFMGTLYDTLTFRKLWLKPLLQISYIALAIYLTISSFKYLSYGETGFKIFLGVLILGNVALRIVYELIMMFIGIYENSKEMNEKIPRPQRPRPMQQTVAQRPPEPRPVQPTPQPQPVNQNNVEQVPPKPPVQQEPNKEE